MLGLFFLGLRPKSNENQGEGRCLPLGQYSFVGVYVATFFLKLDAGLVPSCPATPLEHGVLCLQYQKAIASMHL